QKAFERQEAAGLEDVQVPALGRAGPRRRPRRQGVALDDGDAIRVAAEGMRGREPGHAGADHDDVRGTLDRWGVDGHGRPPGLVAGGETSVRPEGMAHIGRMPYRVLSPVGRGLRGVAVREADQPGERWPRPRPGWRRPAWRGAAR